MTLHLPKEELLQIHDIIGHVLAGDTGKKGVESFFYYHDEGGLDDNGMFLGWKLYVEYRAKTVFLYEKIRKKPGVKASCVNNIGAVEGSILDEDHLMILLKEHDFVEIYPLDDEVADP